MLKTLVQITQRKLHRYDQLACCVTVSNKIMTVFFISLPSPKAQGNINKETSKLLIPWKLNLHLYYKTHKKLN